MKVKLDENIPSRLIPRLEKLGHQVDSVAGGPLQGRADLEVWRSVCQEGAFFVTQDLDFSDLRHFRPGTHPGILIVRLRVPGRKALYDRIAMLFEQENVEAWLGCFVVATDHRIRIRCPRR